MLIDPVTNTPILSTAQAQSLWPWLALAGLLVVGFLCTLLAIVRQQKLIKQLTKECRRVNSVAVGMGQHIIAIEKHVAALGGTSVNKHDEVLEKARLLLKSGASVEEVSHSCHLSHAEASLILAMSQKNNVLPINTQKNY